MVSKVSTPASKSRTALRSRIVAEAGALFMSRGFVAVTSDEIAARLGISKATLYKVFAGKDEIARQVIREFMAEAGAGVERLVDDRSLGFVEKMVALFSFLAAQLARFEPVFVRDLQRCVPEVWREIEAFRQDKIARNFKIILEAGRSEGYFRADVDVDLLLAMFARLIQDFVNPASLVRSGRSPAETFESVIKVFFQGIVTDKGRRDFSAKSQALFEARKGGVS